MIIEILALSLAENVVIFRYNIAGGQIFKTTVPRFVNVSEEEINLMKENAFRGIQNTPQSSKWHTSKVKCENCAKRNEETIQVPVKILLMLTCINKSMVLQQILTAVMNCIVVDKNTVHAKPHSICFLP